MSHATRLLMQTQVTRVTHSPAVVSIDVTRIKGLGEIRDSISEFTSFSECGIAEAAFVATVKPLCTRWVYERVRVKDRSTLHEKVLTSSES